MAIKICTNENCNKIYDTAINRKYPVCYPKTDKQKAMEQRKDTQVYNNTYWNKIRDIVLNINQQGLCLYSYYILGIEQKASNCHHIKPILEIEEDTNDLNSLHRKKGICYKMENFEL